MKVCKGCKRDEGLRFSFDGDPLCKYCAAIAANVVQVVENDHAPSVAPGECCTACNFVKDCGCGTCAGSFRAQGGGDLRGDPGARRRDDEIRAQVGRLGEPRSV